MSRPRRRAGKILPQAVKTLFKKPATVAYPFKGGTAIPDNRGKLVFDASKCVGCMRCVHDCPTGAIDIQKVGEKKFQAILQMDHCVFCGQCVDSCARCALECTTQFELAALNRRGMKTDIGIAHENDDNKNDGDQSGAG